MSEAEWLHTYYLDRAHGLADWHEVSCRTCGSAAQQGRCKRPSGHERAVPHPERAEAFDRLVGSRNALLRAQMLADLAAVGFVASVPTDDACAVCGALPLSSCAGEGRSEECAGRTRAGTRRPRGARAPAAAVAAPAESLPPIAGASWKQATLF